MVALAVAFGLYWFQPWKLLTRSSVDEAIPVVMVADGQPAGSLPGVTSGAEPTRSPTVLTAPATPPAATSAPTPTPGAGPAPVEPPAPGPAPAPAPAEAPPAPPTEPVAVSSGTFVDGEHSTRGTAAILQLPDGSRYLRLTDFSTSDGPDVRVALTDQPAGGEWGSFDDGRYLELGTLKGTDGNQNYAIPSDVDLAGLRSAVIWCERFSVAFGSAELSAAA